MAKILVVEDNLELQQAVHQALKSENHIVESVDDGLEAMQMLETYGYDLIVLDWDLPGLSGVEICRRYRFNGATTLILMLTGKTSTDDKEVGLDAGADDYLCKPFGFSELLSRVRALLRRAGGSAPKILEHWNIRFDATSRQVTKDGSPIDLSHKELGLLELFLTNPQRTYTIEALSRSVWNDYTEECVASVRTHIKTLRKKIDREGQESHICTVHGVGYKLNSQS